MILLNFRTKVEKAWSSETAYNGGTSDSGADPAFGQCAVTALLFQDVFGGAIVKATVNGPPDSPFRTRHYWNIYEGVDVDLTWRQFPVGSEIDISTIEDVDPKSLTRSVRARYDRLKERFAQ